MIYIVLKNGNIDEVFSTREAAEHHAQQLNRKWSITKIVEREVKEI